MRFMRELAFHGVEFLNIWAHDHYIEDFIPIISSTLAHHILWYPISSIPKTSPPKKVEKKKKNSPPTRIPNNPRLSFNKITKPPVKVIHQNRTFLILDNIFNRYKS